MHQFGYGRCCHTKVQKPVGNRRAEPTDRGSYAEQTMSPSLSNPVISPLNESGILTVTNSVQVALAYSNGDSNDIIGVRWRAYDMQSKTASENIATQRGPSAKFSIPIGQICDGTVTVWYSVQDGIGNKSYSEVTTQKIETDTRLLSAPSVTAAPASDSSSGFYAIIPNSPDFGLTLRAGDTVTVQWVRYQADAVIGSPQSQTFVIPGPFASGYKTTALTPAPENDQSMQLWYTLQRNVDVDAAMQGDPTSSQTSLSQTITVFARDIWPSSVTLPAPIFTQAVKNNTLDLSTLFCDYAGVGIPATTALSPDGIVPFSDQGFSPTTGTHIANSDRNSGPLLVASTTYTKTDATPLANLYAVPDGGTYTNHFDAGTSTSACTSVTITQPAKPPPTGTLPMPYFPAAEGNTLIVPPARSASELPIRIDDSSGALTNQKLYLFGAGVVGDTPIPASGGNPMCSGPAPVP